MHNTIKTNTEPPQPMGSTPNNRSTTKEPLVLVAYASLRSKVDYLRTESSISHQNTVNIIFARRKLSGHMSFTESKISFRLPIRGQTKVTLGGVSLYDKIA